MYTKINKTDFGIFGDEFQYKIVKSLMEDREFSNDIIECIDENTFTNPNLKTIVKAIKDYYKNNNTIPTYQALSWELKSGAESEFDLGMLKKTFQDVKETSTENIKDAIGKAVEVVKRLETKKILSNANKSIDGGYNDDKITRIVEQLQTIPRKYVEGESFDMVEFINSDYDGVEDIRIPTGVPELDECMVGGLKKSTLGLLIAGSGFGKTTMSSIMCCNALKAGFKVLHIFFEDTKEEIAIKYIAHLTGCECNRLSEKEFRHRPEIQNMIYSTITKDMWKNNLRAIQMENGETTVEDIKKLVRKLENNDGFKPDMIFIDYFSCLRTTSNENLRATNSWEMETRTIRKIEAFAKTSGIAIWVAEQTNRNGSKLMTANDKNANVQGSWQKTQPASAILYLDRMGVQMPFANLSLTKMRGGQLKDWSEIVVDNATCQIDLSGAIQTDVKLEYTE